MMYFEAFNEFYIYSAKPVKQAKPSKSYVWFPLCMIYYLLRICMALRNVEKYEQEIMKVCVKDKYIVLSGLRSVDYITRVR